MDGSVLVILAVIGFLVVLTLSGGMEDKKVQVEFNGNTLHVSEGDTLNYVDSVSKDTIKVYFTK
jgi:spore germination protein GerM